jgi:hypothetical protein
MSEITSRKRLSEYKPSPFDDVREAMYPEVTKSLFREIREFGARFKPTNWRKKPDDHDHAE